MPPLTVIVGLVLLALLTSVRSLAVNVWPPAVFRVTLNVLVPETRDVLAGKVALVSEEVRRTVSTMVFTRLQLASTALTVTLKGVPATCGLGEPVFPLAVPGAA